MMPLSRINDIFDLVGVKEQALDGTVMTTGLI